MPIVLLALLGLAPGGSPSARAPDSTVPRITILYDAFGDRPGLTRDWGFAALVEYAGRRILFDTGNDPAVFEHNVRALRVDLRRLDFAVISHRHGDHTSGLSYLLRRNPHLTIYAPRESFGVFGAALPASFYRRDTLLPPRMRYFDGAPAAELRFGTPWTGATFRWVDSLTEVAPGVQLLSLVSTTPGTLELRELSLALRTPSGTVLVVGCSHPGIERIVAAAQSLAGHVHLIVGGMHLISTPDAEVARIAGALHDSLRVDEVAPGHCTGEPAFAELQRRFGAGYLYAGLGRVIDGS